MASNEGVRQVLLEQIADLPEEQLQDVLLFVNFLLYSRQQGNSVQGSQEQPEMNGDNTQEPLDDLIGAETIYLSESALGKDWLKPEEEAAWRDL